MNKPFAVTGRMPVLLAAIGLISQVQFVSAATPPSPQVQPLPNGVLLVDNAVAQSITLRWYQPLATAKQPPVEATTFVFCVQHPNYLSSHQCETQMGGNHSAGVWTWSATNAALHRTPVFSGSPFTPPPRTLLGYNYWTTVSLNDTYNDRALRWSLAACVIKDPATCMTTGAPLAWYSTKELVANANIGFVFGDVLVTAEGANAQGTTQATGFTTRITAFPALVGASSICAIDPNESGLGIVNSTKLITRDGQVKLAGQFWNGTRYDVGSTNIVGIVYSNALFNATTTMALDPPPAGPATPAAMVTRTFAVSLLPRQSPAATRFGVVVIASIDDLNQIKEANEADNRWGECAAFSY